MGTVSLFEFTSLLMDGMQLGLHSALQRPCLYLGYGLSYSEIILLCKEEQTLLGLEKSFKLA